MWTVKVDSNVPIKTVTTTGSDSSIADKILKEYQKDGDVEKLLGSQSPFRSRSSSLRGRPQPSAHTSALRSQSPSSINRRQECSLDAVIAKASQLTFDSTNSACDTDSTGCKSDVVHHSTMYGKFDITGSTQVPLKANHNMSTSLLKSYNSVSPSTAQSSKLKSDNKCGITHRINRSGSLSRLDKSANGDSILLPSNHYGTDIRYNSVLDVQRALEESELRRQLLMKQQEVSQATLQLQSEQLSKIASSANDNNMVLQNLQLKEKQYHNIFKQLQASEQQNQMLQAKNLRLQEDMQNRINALDYKLRHLKSQHQCMESKNNKSITLLDQTMAALSMVEEKNSKLQQEKETLQSEISLLKESFDLAKNQYVTMEDDNNNLKNESVKLKEVNITLSRKVQEIAGQMVELHSLLKTVKDENEHLISTLKTYTEDKTWTIKRIQEYQDTISHLKVRLSSVSADRDRLFQEKLDMTSKIQQMMFDKEQLMKTQLILDDQLSEQMSQKSYKKASEFKVDIKEDLTQELAAVRKVKEDLNAELTLLKGLYKQALEQIAVLDWDKSVLQSQRDLSIEQDRFQLLQEVNRLSQDGFRKQQLVTAHLPLAGSDKLQEELEKHLLEYNNLKHEYDSLVAKHQQPGHTGEVAERELEMIDLRKEKDSVQKQLAILQGQMLLLEGSKKRADDQVYKLTSEVEELQLQIKECSKSSPQEESSLSQEVEMLKLQLDKAKEDQRLQHNFIESLREKTLSDERLELQQLKDKLHELFREIEQKNQTIGGLKFDLKSFTEMAEAKQKEVNELFNVIEEIKIENQILRQNVKVINNSAVVVSQEQEQQTSKQPQSVRAQQEELLETVTHKQDSCDKSDNNSLSSFWSLQSINDTHISQASTSSADNSSHLPVTMFSEHKKENNEVASKQHITNSLPRYEPFKLVSSSWAPSPKWQINTVASSLDTDASQDSDSLSQVKSLKPTRKLPPPPPSKPLVMSKSLSIPTDSTSRDMGVVSSTFDISTTETSSLKWPTLPSGSTSASPGRSGLGQSTYSTENQDEPQDHNIVNELIIKFEEMAAF